MRVILAIFALLVMAVPTAQAQSAVQCPIYDTTVLSVNNTKLISQCHLSSGTYDSIFSSMVGEVVCNTGNEAGFTMALGWLNPGGGFPGPSSGAHFIGSIASGVLTVTSMITPAGYGIASGDYLHDGQSGAGIPSLTDIPGVEGTRLVVGTQIDGTPGGVGHYTVTGPAATVAPEDMWSLGTYPGGTSTAPSGGSNVMEDLDNSACTNGKSYIVNVVSVEVSNSFLPNTDLWITFMVKSTLAGGGTAAKSTSVTNGQMSLFAPVPYTPGKGGLVQ